MDITDYVEKYAYYTSAIHHIYMGNTKAVPVMTRP